MLWREPVLFIRQVDQLRRQRPDDLWNAESDCQCKNADARKNDEERRLRLPPVRCATPIEVGGDKAGQLRVVIGKMDGRVQHQQRENKFGQSGIQSEPLSSSLTQYVIRPASHLQMLSMSPTP